MQIAAALLLLLSVPFLPAGGTSPVEPGFSGDDPRAAAFREFLEDAGMRGQVALRAERRYLVTACLASSPDPRVRRMRLMLFAQPEADGARWRVRVRATLLGGVPEFDADDYNVRIHELAQKLDLLRFERAGDDEGPGPSVHVVATQHASAADPAAFASFLGELGRELSAILAAETGAHRPVFVSLEEHAELVPEQVADALALRLARRAELGLRPHWRAPSHPSVADPSAFAANLLHPGLVVEALRHEEPDSLARLLEHEREHPVPARRALYLAIRARADGPDSAAAGKLMDLAYDPVTRRPRDAWALGLWGDLLARAWSEDERQEDLIAALDALLESARLGCEFGLNSYVALQEAIGEPVPGAEAHWQRLPAWSALHPHYAPHQLADEVALEQAYAAGDFSAVVLGVPRNASDLTMIRLALAEMNTARLARGWKPYALMEESPAEPRGD